MALQRPEGFPIAVTIAAALALLALTFRPAPAKDHGFPDSPQKRWMESLKMPPYYGVGCCGVGDGYPVDRYTRRPDGSYEAWIADGSAKVFPDGKHRNPWDESVPVIVPAERVNREDDDLDNPGNFGVVFMSVPEVLDGNGAPVPAKTPLDIYCFVRHPQGN
jgi:hypothetical protein